MDHQARRPLLASAIVLLAAAELRGDRFRFQNGVSPTPAYAGCRDTWISDNPYEDNRDFSKSEVIACGPKRTILIRFDLAGLPAGASIRQAVLRLWDTGYPRKGEGGRFASAFGAFRLAREWKDDANWREHTRTNYKEADAGDWKTPGGDLGKGAKGLISEDVLIDGPLGHVHELDVTAAVKAWASAEAPNHGLALRMAGRGGDSRLASSEWYVPAARPLLIVAYGAKDERAAIEPLTPAPKEIELDDIARTAGADPKAGAVYGTIRIGASADAHIKEAALKWPGTWGWMDFCRVGGSAGDFSRTLIRFDLSDIPRGASIEKATLRLALAPYTNQQVETYRYGAYLLRLPDTPGWTAEDVDAVLRKAGAKWPEGGVAAASPRTPIAIGKVLSRNEKDRHVTDAIEFDLTGAVRAWVSGKVPNCGIVLDNRLEGGAYDVYSSRAFQAAKRPYLELTLAPAIERRPEAAGDVSPALAGDYWVEPMRRAHARFEGKKGQCVLYGDSITYSMAFLGTAAWGEKIAYKNVSAETLVDLEAVWAHADRAFWRERDPSLGHQGAMRSDWFLSNIDGWQSRMKPEACVILFGTNDLGGLCPPEYTENMAACVRRILGDGTVPMLTTVPPASGRERFIDDYYRASWIIARHFRIPVIDYCGEILRRRPNDWDGALPQHREKVKDEKGRVDEYEVHAPISADGTHPSNPKPYRGDFSEEALNNNGYVLRDYLTLRKYGEVIRKVFRDGARIRKAEGRP